MGNGKWEMLVKEKRKMRPSCAKNSCRKSKIIYCNEFTEEDQENIFEQFSGILVTEIFKIVSSDL